MVEPFEEVGQRNAVIYKTIEVSEYGLIHPRSTNTEMYLVFPRCTMWAMRADCLCRDGFRRLCNRCRS